MLYAVTHDGHPFPSIVDAFDIYGAARKYKAAIESSNNTEIINGESLTICPLVSLPADRDAPAGVGYGEDITLAYNERNNNFQVPDDEAYCWQCETAQPFEGGECTHCGAIFQEKRDD